MYMLSEYSIMSTISTTLVFGLIFIYLAKQDSRFYMSLWGLCWMIYSLMFFLDFTSLIGFYINTYYIVIKQALSLFGALIFLIGAYDFFHLKPPKSVYFVSLLFFISILLSGISKEVFKIFLIPNIMFSTYLLISAGCMFISYSWTQNIPEKFFVSFLIILWGIFSNHFGFTINHLAMATFNYYIGLFTVNLLILFLMIIHFKKIRFLLVKSEDRFRLLVENSDDCMFLYYYKKRSFQYISPSINLLLGVTATDLYIKPERFFENIVIDKENLKLTTLFEKPLKKASMSNLCLIKDDQPYRWCEMHYLPILDALGVVIAVEGILRDITESKKMEENLKASESARKELVENISHELRTPITLIQGYTESMLNEVVPVTSIQTYLKMIHSKTLMLNTLLEDLIQVSHFTSQTIDYKFYELNAYEYFNKMIAQSEFQISRSGKIFQSTNTINNKIIIIVDPSRIEQVITNLINNSIRHTPKGGCISVFCSNYIFENNLNSVSSVEPPLTIPEGEITFTVIDTGDGIHPDDLPHLFERRFKARNQSGNKAINSSSGLGLFISLQIIKQHSGRMWTKNNPDCGAQFSFSIPYYKDAN